MRIFLSYSSQDRDDVKIVASDLEALEHEVWFDQDLTGGTDWWNSILDAIRRCDVFVFCLSEQSLGSLPCELERTYANALGKSILPVLISEVDLQSLPLLLTRIQYVDYRKHDRDSVLRLNKALRNVPVAPTLPDPLPPAPEVPLSTVYKLEEQVNASRLTYEQQAAFLLGLDDLTAQGRNSRIIPLLDRFLARSDLAPNVRKRATELYVAQKKAQNSAPTSRLALTAVGVVIALIAVIFIGSRVLTPSPSGTPSSNSTPVNTQLASVSTKDSTSDAIALVVPSATGPSATDTTIPATTLAPATASLVPPTMTPTSTATFTASPNAAATSTENARRLEETSTTFSQTATKQQTDLDATRTTLNTLVAQQSINASQTAAAQQAAQQAYDATQSAREKIAMDATNAWSSLVDASRLVTADFGSNSHNNGSLSPLSLTSGPFTNNIYDWPKWKFVPDNANFEVKVRIQAPPQASTATARYAGLMIFDQENFDSVSWGVNSDNSPYASWTGMRINDFNNLVFNENNQLYGKSTSCTGNDIRLLLRKMNGQITALCKVGNGNWTQFDVIYNKYIPQYGDVVTVALFATSRDEQNLSVTFSEFTYKRLQ